MHPEAAAARDIVAGSWVRLRTPIGTMLARARLNDKLDPRVALGNLAWRSAQKGFQVAFGVKRI